LEKISRRKFVTTTAVAGASAVLCAPSLAFENQSMGSDGVPEAPHKAREVATLQAVPFRMSDVRLRVAYEIPSRNLGYRNVFIRTGDHSSTFRTEPNRAI